MSKNEKAKKHKYSLSNHKKVKKKLVSPWNQMMGFEINQLTDWKLERMPELFWISELIHWLGDRRSLDILKKVIDIAYKFDKSERNITPLLAAFWKFQTKATCTKIIRGLKDAEVYDDLIVGLSELICLYPEYPLCQITPKEIRCDALNIDNFKNRLVDMMDRFSLIAIKVHAHAFIVNAESGRLKFARGIDIPDINIIYEPNVDEECEEFNRASSFVRSSFGAQFAHEKLKQNEPTALYFWDNGLKIEECYEF